MVCLELYSSLFVICAALFCVAYTQRAPCYVCMLQEAHLRNAATNPYRQAKSAALKSGEATSESVCGKCEQCVSGPPTSCAEDVRRIKDGCGCCEICSRQLGDACDEKFICDIKKGLQCYKNRCIGNSTRFHCFAEGSWYENGKDYTIGCERKCSCSYGYFICTSLCPHEREPPAGCPNARLVSIPGQCCKEWFCDQVSLLHGLYQKSVKVKVTARTLNTQYTNCSQMRPTQWSSCSTSCGWGESVRYSDGTCEPHVRACRIRPCELAVKDRWVVPHFKRHISNKYDHLPLTVLTHSPQKIQLNGCISEKMYKTRSCKTGIKGDNCCQPIDTFTRNVRMSCPTKNETTNMDIMFIRKCICGSHCM